MTTQTKADWINIDPATLSAEQRNLYDTYKAQYRVMKAARLEFEAAMQAGCPEGHKVVCGYNYGKLSVAVVLDDAKPTRSAKAQVSLAAYLAERARSGLQN